MKNLFLFILLAMLSTSSFADETKSTFDNMVESRTLRCGYGLWEPGFMKDPNTGEMSGVFYDYMNEISKATGIKVEWVAEIGWGDVPVAIQTKKIDAMCAGKWIDAKEGSQLSFTTPIIYNAVEAYARIDDNRFDNNFSKLNNPQTTIAAIDGGVTSHIIQEDFPLATVFSIPNAQSDVDQLLSVSTKKADITFTNQGMALSFMKNNPNKIKRLAPNKPLRVYGVTVAVDIHEQELLSFLNTVTSHLLNSGVIDKILNKYEPKYHGTFSRASKLYIVTK